MMMMMSLGSWLVLVKGTLRLNGYKVKLRTQEKPMKFLPMKIIFQRKRVLFGKNKETPGIFLNKL